MKAIDIWTRIDIGEPDECWEWQGPVVNSGYGYVGKRLAHRVVLEMVMDADLGDLCALHHCDNKLCCNPSHLYAGTYRDNARDRVERGQHRMNFTPGHNRLDDIIRKRVWGLRAEGLTYVEIAQQVGIGKSPVGNILKTT